MLLVPPQEGWDRHCSEDDGEVDCSNGPMGLVGGLHQIQGGDGLPPVMQLEGAPVLHVQDGEDSVWRVVNHEGHAHGRYQDDPRCEDAYEGPYYLPGIHFSPLPRYGQCPEGVFGR